MTEAAKKVFELGTESPDLYNHANDPWNGVKHWEYSGTMRELLQDWIRKNRGKLGEGAAKEFLSWIAKGECDNAEFLAQHKEAFAKVFKWRAGFKQSVVVAARAKELNPKLTGAELKAIAQQFVNGESKPLSRAAASVAQTIIKGGTKGLMATAKKVLPGLMFLSAATAAKRGWTGEGHTGSGAWGAVNEAARDAMSADLVEKLAFPKVLDTVDGMVNVLVPALSDPTRHRRVWRNGRWYDAQTWLPIE